MRTDGEGLSIPGRRHGGGSTAGRPPFASHWCGCGREIIRGRHTGRWPTRCTICRDLQPPPYEDHDRAKAVAIAPDGWPREGAGGSDERADQPGTGGGVHLQREHGVSRARARE